MQERVVVLSHEKMISVHAILKQLRDDLPFGKIEQALELVRDLVGTMRGDVKPNVMADMGSVASHLGELQELARQVKEQLWQVDKTGRPMAETFKYWTTNTEVAVYGPSARTMMNVCYYLGRMHGHVCGLRGLLQA
jgi:hypothetical protein